jgi:anti-sigma regulatory factor (Ser/Thr protein kinase)
VLVVRRQPLTTAFDMFVPADPRQLAAIRLRVRRWLTQLDVDAETVDDAVLAVSELASNCCLHAYPPLSTGSVAVRGSVDDHTVRIEVTDEGRWRAATPSMGGRGLQLIRDLGFDLSVDTQPSGTTAIIAFEKPRPALVGSR